MTDKGKQPTQFEEFDRKTQDIIRTVGEIMKIPEYPKIFSSFQKKFVLPKFVCYYVLYERGLSYPQIGRKFKRNHTTIMSAIAKAKKLPECIVIANIVNAKLKRQEEQETVIVKYRTGEQKNKLYDQIKGYINNGMSDEEVCLNVDIPAESTEEIINLIKRRCKMKKIPDYKNCTIKQIYV
jgi:hypothetical protein|nr:MAG TPA: ATPase [Caudoviricetes sp.]